MIADYFQTFEARSPQIASHSSQNAAVQFAIEEFKRFMSIAGTLSHPLIFSRAKMQLEVGILMRRVLYDES